MRSKVHQSCYAFSYLSLSPSFSSWFTFLRGSYSTPWHFYWNESTQDSCTESLKKIQYNKKSNHQQQHENELLNTKQDQVEISLEKENWIHRIYQWTSIIIIILTIVVVIFSGGCCLLDSCAWSPIYPPISLCKADFEVLYN